MARGATSCVLLHEMCHHIVASWRLEALNHLVWALTESTSSEKVHLEVVQVLGHPTH